MQNRHQQNIEILNQHLITEPAPPQALSTEAYVEEVSRYLARIRQQPATQVSQRH